MMHFAALDATSQSTQTGNFPTRRFRFFPHWVVPDGETLARPTGMALEQVHRLPSNAKHGPPKNILGQIFRRFLPGNHRPAPRDLRGGRCGELWTSKKDSQGVLIHSNRKVFLHQRLSPRFP